MTINWYGEGCFKLQEGPVTIMVDPFSAKGGSASGGEGLSAPRFKADIVIKTLTPALHEGKGHPETHDGEMFNVSGPGEYEVKGISISGWPLIKDSSPTFLKSVYRVKTDDITVGLLGHISESSEPEIFEELGDIDVLIMPGGGKPFISQEAAAKLIRQISPRLVIPSFFHVPGLKRKADSVSEFLKEIGQKAEPEEKLSIKKKELGEKMRVVVLKP